MSDGGTDQRKSAGGGAPSAARAASSAAPSPEKPLKAALSDPARSRRLEPARFWRDRLPDLGSRAASGLALGAAAAAALWLGGLWTALFVAAAAALMGWELRCIVASGRGGFQRRDVFFPVIAGAAPLLAHFQGGLAWALALVGVGALIVVAADRGARDWRWTAPGLLLLGGSAACFVFLRDQPDYGLETCVWLVLVVVATDIGGYFAGRLIGGPKLAPRLSPSKTWAGLCGGMALAALVGGLFSWATTGTLAHEVGRVSLVAALVAQGGDLAESALKRRFGVKDASGLIPGHGGVLDRLDGLLAATIVAAALTVARGKEVFVW